MPTYEYKCEACKEEFMLIMSLSERDKTRVTCPKCRSEEIKQLISAFTSKTSRKS